MRGHVNSSLGNLAFLLLFSDGTSGEAEFTQQSQYKFHGVECMAVFMLTVLVKQKQTFWINS